MQIWISRMKSLEVLGRMDLNYRLSTTGQSQGVAAAFKWVMGIQDHINLTLCYLPDSSGYLSITLL